jgi:DNA primase
MNIDPTTTKYLINARIVAEGIVEKPDVVGAIFGQTEGLLGDDLDLRDLQKSGRIGRIEVEIEAKKGKSEGEITIPSSLDQVETAILASSLETIDRVGPCKAQINVNKIEDVRVSRRNKIVDRAKILLAGMMDASKNTSLDLTESVRQAVQIEEIVSYGKERLPAGPNIDNSDAIIIVEGRSDVINLLKCGIKNVIAVEGTSVPKTVQDVSREKVVTAFVDGDRGGELILRELLQVAEIDFVARAPRGQEVEELTEKQIMKILRNKIPVDQAVELYGFSNGGELAGRKKAEKAERESPPAPGSAPHDRADAERPFPPRDERPAPAPVIGPMPADGQLPGQAPSMEPSMPPPPQKPEKKLSPQQARYRKILNELQNTHKAKLLNAKDNVLAEINVGDLVEYLKTSKEVTTVIFDGIITQRLVDVGADIGLTTILGNKLGNITKLPTSIQMWTKPDLE